MKYLLLILLLCGCKSLDKKIIRDSRVDPNGTWVFDLNNRPVFNYTNVPYVFHKQLASMVEQPVTHTLTWLPGDYDDFVIIESFDLLTWDTLTETSSTLVQNIPDYPQQFFALYGTNQLTGDYAWATK